MIREEMRRTMNDILIAEHVQKQYGRFQALQDASLSIRQGEILALLGPNGAGKTTLIKILATLLNPDGGEVQVMGRRLDRDAEAIRHCIGYVGQDTERSAYARLTVWENLSFFGSLRGMSAAQIRRQGEALADAFDFHEKMNSLFVTLSGGQKQTMVIMRALLHDPPLIYLDEPTKGLDPIIGRRIRAFLKDYVRQRQKSLLLTSHVLSEVEDMADRVALIQRGRIPICGTAQSLKAALGAQEYIELEKNSLPAATVQRILGLAVVRGSLERDPGWYSFGVEDALAGAEGIIRVLREDGVQQAHFRHHSASLEDAFLHHMGELSERFDQ
jgi:ABC-2 type transport system ATP-binding protein